MRCLVRVRVRARVRVRVDRVDGDKEGDACGACAGDGSVMSRREGAIDEQHMSALSICDWVRMATRKAARW